jgi:hypothetical protein
MKNLFIAVLSVFTFTTTSFAASQYIPAEPIIASRDCVLKLIAPYMYSEIDASKTVPVIRTQTDTTLEHFQDSIEKFWGFRPDAFTNVFNPVTNEIFIMTERSYYEKYDRSVYDSLAHELSHYIQFAYKGADFSVGDDSLEAQAVDVQNWFRETYKSQFVNDEFICPPAK